MAEQRCKHELIADQCAECTGLTTESHDPNAPRVGDQVTNRWGDVGAVSAITDKWITVDVQGGGYDPRYVLAEKFENHEWWVVT